jgi:hypothetical protein
MENRMEHPDSWVIVQLPSKTEYKLLAGYSGGYLYGNSWRLNSGIKSFHETDDNIVFNGYSGSEYCCNKGSERISMSFAGVLDTLLGHGCCIVDYEDFKTDFNQISAVS